MVKASSFTKVAPVSEEVGALFFSGALALQFVELLAALEESFGVQISVEEIEIDDFRTLSRIARFMAGKPLGLAG